MGLKSDDRMVMPVLQFDCWPSCEPIDGAAEVFEHNTIGQAEMVV